MIKIFSILLIFLAWFSACKNSVSGEFSEKKIEDTLLTLKEVKEAGKQIDSITNHKKGISFIIDKPTADEPSFQASVGYNGDERFETYFRFFLNPKTKEILIADPVTTERLTLDEWRIMNNNISDSIYVDRGMELLQKETIGSLKFDLPLARISKLLGKPDSISEAYIWDSDGLYHQTILFRKKGIELDVCNEKGKEQKIFRINITKPCNYKTSRNIKIGSSKKELLDAYRIEIDPRTINDEQIIAGSVFGGMFFLIENNKVKAIFLGAAAE